MKVQFMLTKLRRIWLMLALMAAGGWSGVCAKTFYAAATATAVLQVDGAISTTTACGNVNVQKNTVPSSADKQTASATDNWTVAGPAASLTNSHAFTFGFLATPRDGYYFVAWYENETCTLYKGKETAYAEDVVSNSIDASAPATANRWAMFKPVDLWNANAVSIAVTDPSPASEAYRGSVDFKTENADADVDFASPVFTDVKGNGTFTIEGWSFSNGTVTVNYKFAGKGHFGSDSNPRNRRNSAILRVASKGGENEGICRFTANFPAIEVSAGTGEDAGGGYNMTTVPNVKKQGTVTFAVQWADDKDDFTASFSEQAGNGAWTIDDVTYTPSDANSGVVTVTYTFDPQNSEGDNSAKLMLAAVTGASNEAVLKARSEAVAVDDAEVISGNDTVRHATLATALADANSKAGCTLRLLRNIPSATTTALTSPLVVTGTMTIDLNSFSIMAADVSAAMTCLFEVNAADGVVTIADSRLGGRIEVDGNVDSETCAIRLTKGRLNIYGGTIVSNNTGTNAAAAATAVSVTENSTFLMSAGRLQAESAVGNATGVYAVIAATDALRLSGGEITVSGKADVYGIHAVSAADIVMNPSKPQISLSALKLSATADMNVYAVRTEDAVTLAVNSGTYTALANQSNVYGVYSEGSLTVTGGTIQATATISQAGALHVAKGIAIVHGGTMTAEAATTDANGMYISPVSKAFVASGIFSGSLTNEDIEGKATGACVAAGAELEAQGGSFRVQIAHPDCKYNSHAGLEAGIRAFENSRLTLQNVDIRATSVDDNLNQVFGIFTYNTAKFLLTNSNIYVNAKDRGACGIGVSSISTDLPAPKIDIISTGISVTAKENAIGIRIGTKGVAYVINSDVQATTALNGARGMYANCDFIDVENTQFTITAGQGATSQLKDMYSLGINNYSEHAYVSGGRIRVTGNAAYSNMLVGIMNEGYIILDNDPVVEVSSAYGLAAAIYPTNYPEWTEVRSGKYLAQNAPKAVSLFKNYGEGYVTVKGGCFSQSDGLSSSLPAGYGIAMLPETSSEYQEGYRFRVMPTKDLGTTVCKIGSTAYSSLEEAMEYANRNSGTETVIYMTADYTLPKGNYLLPRNATLLVPYREGSGAGATTPIGEKADRTNRQGENNAYLTLTLAKGANLTVQGVVEASAQQYVQTTNTGRVQGPYGMIVLEAGSHIDLENGARMYAWGYVTGLGTINAKRGSVVLEQFELGDFKGGGVTSTMLNNGQKVFPVTHYFYQNIEAPVTYRPGSAAIAHAGASVNSSPIGTDTIVKIVGITGSDALFLMNEADDSENTWVRKQYYPETDRTEYTLSSGAVLGSLTVNIDNTNLESKRYILPISSNMTIVAQYGTTGITQDSYFMPGAEMIVGKEAVLMIPAGRTLTFVDKAEWNMGYPNKWYIYTAAYSPTRGSSSVRDGMKTSMASVPSARLMVHGKVEVWGALCTTASGADICSTVADAGKVVFKADAPASVNTKLNVCTNDCGFNASAGSYRWSYSSYALSPAMLHNEDGSYAATASTPKHETWVYCKSNGKNQWVRQTETDCMTTVDGTQYYVNPSDIVEVIYPAQSNHTYKAKSAARYFVWDEDCQWWEVESSATADGCFRAKQTDHEGRRNYYEYYAAGGYWRIKTVSVRWNINGTLTTYTVPYGATPCWHGAHPQKSGSQTDYYVWTGWNGNSAGGTLYLKDAALPAATSDVTYFAHFDAYKYKYTVTFRNYDGSVLEAARWSAGSMPSYSGTPERTPKADTVYTFLGWTPAITAVQGTAEYRACYSASARKYRVMFVNHDGSMLYMTEAAYGTLPVYEGATPVHKADAYYSYQWDGTWSPALSAVTAEQTYTPSYLQREREYGKSLDIADWSESGLLLNMNRYDSLYHGDWTVTVAGTDYKKANVTDSTAVNGTMAVAAPALNADEELLIEMNGADTALQSRRTYMVPHIVNEDTKVSALTLDDKYRSVIRVRNGATLTIDKDVHLASVYVSPDASLKIERGRTLLAEKVVLRSNRQSAARLTDNGTLKARLYYTRMAATKQAMNFALPLPADLGHVMFSYGDSAGIPMHYEMQCYAGQSRPNDDAAWQAFSALDIETGKGYKLGYKSDLYTELYFPVEYSGNVADAAVQVTCDGSTAHEADRGWNFISSPCTSVYECIIGSEPENALKVNIYDDEAHVYRQYVAEYIEPALSFYYQTPAAGDVLFTQSGEIVQPLAGYDGGTAATQWIRIVLTDASGHNDETNIYLHPHKFTANYERGYDLVKLSATGNSPLIYTKIGEDNLAFAAVPDSVGVDGMALAVYMPEAGAVTIAKADNEYMKRIEQLWLCDAITGGRVNLLNEDYTCNAEQGTTMGRFSLQVALNNNIDGIEEHTDDSGFKAWALGREVIVSRLGAGQTLRCYNALGQLICLAQAVTGEIVRMAVPAAGVYMVQSGAAVRKVTVQ